ncbi:MAG TPA: hypothetical protein VEP30_02320 [Chthoniobacterales bacterium]|nr:hypothetical protein [Chthoniobacterales bacterium]
MVRRILLIIELAILSALVLATRCANYRDVFVAGNIYFTDADCYARMTRVRICAEHPGLIIRHHDFENFPVGTTPHTTAPLDYLIVSLSILLKPFTAHPIDLAGAVVSPFLALLAGWFLWGWSRRMKLRYRWIMLLLYAISPILVHGTELGRPDHQSLLIVLVTIGVCAEWSLRDELSTGWSVANGIAWSLALWVSFYEPLVLFILVLLVGLTKDRHLLVARNRRIGWIVFAAIIAIALLVERRLPAFAIFQSSPLFNNWARTIGELAQVSPLNRIWFAWAGYIIAIAPILIWYSFRKRIPPPSFIVVLLVATFLLTVWQARWSYFFVLVFVIALPDLMAPIKSRVAVWAAFVLSMLPVLELWDARIWPNEAALAAQIERQNESRQLLELAMTIRSERTHAFLAPWWLSPSISYWSHQPGVAGSSHEALDGIADSARFFVVTDFLGGREILRNRRVDWVLAYDWERVAQNSADLLGTSVPDHAIGRILDRTPGQAPPYLVLSGQNQTAKLFRFANKL